MVLRRLQDVRRLWYEQNSHPVDVHDHAITREFVFCRQHWRLDVSAVLLQLREELSHGLPGPARRQEAQVSVEVSALSGPPRQGAEGGGGQQREEKNR
jgi:hypothetical protein